MAMCRRQLMTSCSEKVLGLIIKQLIKDCTHKSAEVRHPAMRLLFDRCFGKAPVFIETKHDETIKYIKEIILVTPEKARPPGLIEATLIDSQDN